MYTLNLPLVLWQLYLNKAGKKLQYRRAWKDVQALLVMVIKINEKMNIQYKTLKDDNEIVHRINIENKDKGSINLETKQVEGIHSSHNTYYNK